MDIFSIYFLQGFSEPLSQRFRSFIVIITVVLLHPLLLTVSLPTSKHLGPNKISKAYQAQQPSND